MTDSSDPDRTDGGFDDPTAPPWSTPDAESRTEPSGPTDATQPVGTGAHPADPGDRPAGEPFGAAPFGQGLLCRRPIRRRPYGQAPYGQTPYGQAPYGQAPYGQAPYGQAPYGQAPYGQLGPAQTPVRPAALRLDRLRPTALLPASGSLRPPATERERRSP